MIGRLLLGAVLAAGTSKLAIRFRALTGTGAVAATLVGTIVFTAGLDWTALLVLFFVSSSALSRLAGRDPLAPSVAAKGSRRDAWQVLANGAVPAACAGLWIFHPTAAWTSAYIGSLAAATADTWATEVGGLSAGDPWHVLMWRRVPRGTSGAVTLLGLGGAMAGSLTIAAAGAVLMQTGVTIAATALVAGFTGASIDTALGATVQEMYRCSDCGQSTEQRYHAVCHARTVKTRGVTGMNNDVVNLTSCAAAALLCLLLSLV